MPRSSKEELAVRYRLSEIIGIQPGFKAAVDISQDLENKDKIRGYIPTENAIKVLELIFDYLKPHTSTRPLILTGTYGTGKSHLGLAIATLFRKELKDELYNSLFAKIESKWTSAAGKIRRAKESYGEKPYLLVYLEAEEKVDWGPGFFNNSLVLALKEALKREGLEDITPRTAYDRALERIQEIKRDFPDHYSQLEREIANTTGYYSVEDIERKLHKQDKKALEDFAEIHKKVSAGAVFDWFSGISASEAYTATIEALKEKGYKGILLIWDEFTSVLRKLVEDPSSGEANAFQKFAQTCEAASANKIISIFISIRDIQEVIDRAVIESLRGESLRKDAEKISARFRVMRLGSIDRETYHLMKGVIIHKDEFEEIKRGHNERFLEIKNVVDELNLFYEYRLTNEDKRVIIEDLYPLHPLSTLVLSRLSDQVGQRERTIFTFLCDAGEGTFRDFLEEREVERTLLPFLYPFEVESYFLPLIRQSDKKELRRLDRKYEETIASLSPGDEIGGKILKTIFLLNAAGVHSTTEHIVFALGCFTESDKREIQDKLGALKEERRITQRLSDKTWRFWGQSLDVAMDDHIREVIDEERYTPKELFNESLKKADISLLYRSIKAENYNTDRDIERKIDLEFVTVGELDKPDSLRRKIEEGYLDGEYYFVLADTEEELSEARKRIQEHFLDDATILFGLPTNAGLFQEIIPYLRRFKALEELPNRYPQYKSDLREEHISEEDDVKKFLKNKLDEILDPSKGHLEFYYLREKREIEAINRLRELVSEMMENTFPYTPSISREELIKEEGGDTWRSRYRIPLIDMVLSQKAPSLLIQETESVKQHIINVIYKRHNILRQESGKWVIEKPISSPDNNAMVKIWEEVENFIKRGAATNTFNNFLKLIRMLRLPPFGLKRRTIGLILAPVLREYVLHGNLVLKWKGEPIEKINGELIEERIVLRSQQIMVKFQPITEKGRTILSAVADVFNSSENDTETVYKTVVNWWIDLPQCSRNTNKISEEAKKLKDSFFVPLSTQEESKRVLFYSILPGLVGIEDLGRETDKEVEKITTEKLKQIKDEFEKLISRLHEEIKSALVGVFEDERGLLVYHSNLPGDTQNTIFTGDAKKLMDWLKEADGKESFELEDFVALGEEILGKCDNWNDEQVSVLKGHLESAKNQIESYTPPIALPGKSEEESEDLHLLKGREMFKIGGIKQFFTLYENLDEAPNKEQVQILLNVLKGGLLPALKNGQITWDEFLSILYHLIKEFENA